VQGHDRECTDTTEAFYQAWVPNMTHIITFLGRQLTKQQKRCKMIKVIISNKAKTPHFVWQMYKSDYFTEKQMTVQDPIGCEQSLGQNTCPLHGAFLPTQGLRR
jgi:hypothetical protein